MRRILLIDPSICGYGGHYLEYALSVLNQAAVQGGRCLLAVNRRFGPKLVQDLQNRYPVQVLPLFQYTFWDIYGTCPYLRDFGSSKRHSRTLICRRTAKSLRQKARVRQFQKDLEELFRQIRPHSSDLFFFPTVCHLETEALAKVLTKIRPAYASVHLLFRRPLYQSGDWEKEKNNPLVRDIRAKLARTAGMGCGRLYFYTDTDRLAEQYNSLKIVPFTVLPIPHTKTPPSARRHGRLIAGCLGEAREEKGFCILPGLISHCKSDRILYMIQINTKEASYRMLHALHKLRRFPKRKAVLLGELSDEAYGKYLAAIDLMLLFYEPAAYHARSSGIFVEAVAAGCVVLVTAGTWMAEQVRMLDDVYGLRIGELCSDPSEAVYQLARIERRFVRYQKDAAKAAEIYRSMHNPEKLLEKILEKELQG